MAWAISNRQDAKHAKTEKSDSGGKGERELGPVRIVCSSSLQLPLASTPSGSWRAWRLGGSTEPDPHGLIVSAAFWFEHQKAKVRATEAREEGRNWEAVEAALTHADNLQRLGHWQEARALQEAILRALRWVGLSWDEGPDIDGPHGPYRQSERLHLYQSYVAELMNASRAYHCFCSTAQLEAERQQALATGRPAHYAGTCRRLSKEQAAARVAAGERPAIRFRVPEGRDVTFTDVVRGEVRFHADVIGDPVIVRADGTPAYNFAVVVDDALMGAGRRTASAKDIRAALGLYRRADGILIGVVALTATLIWML